MPKPFPQAEKPHDRCWSDPPVPLNTTCKHGLGECERCGTSRRKDTIHTTRGGVGKVGALFKKRK